ncbi:MAG: polysulfide reductase NrfD [Bacteroidetes bacterium]|nr:polysulfide reductase NrfD [Bacteroidota bacterium]MBU1578930.1 polysulfide reductase NrfD [Bacteroidota bacterium]MBU2556973.1 polysulfide reductase NrfD [Bacteroidota bacterium]
MNKSATTPLYLDNKAGNTFKFLLNELKPKGKMFTPFNIISIPVIITGIIIMYIRFTQGIGSVTNLTQEVPWGLWIGFDVVTGVAFAGGAYVLVFMVYILNLEKYRPIVRVTVLNGFLAYLFYSAALLLDLGRPLKIINVIIGNDYGVSSVLFLVGWHFLLYMLALLLEFSPAIAEWLNARKARKFLAGMTLAAVIFGITLSVLHQSGIGALFLMAKDKIHPLWYNAYMPLMFVVSSVFGGISMVIIEGSISSKVFDYQTDKNHHKQHNGIMHGLAKICAVGMFVYFFMQIIIFVHQQNYAYIFSPMGYWFLLEMLGFVLLPMVLFFISYRTYNITLVKIAGVLALLGIVLNRMNISIIAFQWEAAVRYIPTWQEFVVTLTIIFIEIWVLRWIITRMPVLRKSPDWVNDKH